MARRCYTPFRGKLDVMSTLVELAEYLADRADVRDGDYGVPAPNREMVLLDEVERAIAFVEAA